LSPPLARQPLPDALRALAMLAVLTVNAAGYLVAPWGALLGERSPPDSGLALALQGLVAALLQGKGYPMLAFLFGMGLFLSLRAQPAVPGLRSAPPRAVRRQKRLLKLGVLHGVFIYFGDILTMYALMGWQLLRHVREPWPALRRRLRRALGWTLAAALLSIVLALLWAVPSLVSGDAPAGDTAFEADPTLAQTRHLLDFWLLNASAYAVMQIGALLLLCPLLRLCMLCGVAAARLRLLTHRRWRHSLWRCTRRWALPLVLLNVGYGVAYVSVVDGSQRALWVELLGTLIGPPLSAVYVMALALLARGGHAAWCLWFAPLGRCTLSLYVGFSLLCAVLFTGLGLGWQLGTLTMALFSALVWGLALAAAHASGARRWPLERWMARR
jgi:uncharacterized protein